ncbi:MAG: phage tail tube protein [Gammaproteobacteria bacterium]
MAVKFWSSVTVAMQSALAAADTITAITKADPGVASSTSHGMSDGAYALITAQGMTEVNKRVIRVDNPNANDFELEGIDTTNFGTFTSGTAEEITFGTTIATLTDINASGGDPEFEDTTTIHDNIRSQVPVVTSPLTFTFESIWDPSDAGLLALQTASDGIEERAFRFTFSDGAILLFNGYVSAPLAPTGSAQGKVTTPVTITVEGRTTVYAS